jgi:chaperone modulatory protein CbpM
MELTMSEQLTMLFSMHEVCETTRLSPEQVIDLIEHGALAPIGSRPEDWRFSATETNLIRRAERLHRELDVAWENIALVLQLLEQRDALRTEIVRLRQRLLRFESE